MKEKKSFICVFAIILIFVFILVTGLSCQIDLLPGSTISESGEEISTDKSNSMIEDEEYEDMEKEKEIAEVNLWIDEAVPEDISIKIRNELRKAFDEIEIVDSREGSNVRAEINVNPARSMATWVLVPAVSFFRNFDDISYDDFKEFWAGNREVLNYISVDGSGPQLVLTEKVFKVLERILGKSGNGNIKIVSEEELMSGIENNNSFSIVPFDSIEKEYKVLNVDNMSVFDRELDVGSYPLAVGISLESSNPEIESKIAECFEESAITNRDMEKMTSVIMTGVTAMVRGTANRMERYGVLYPAEKIADVLRNADITHISNEVPFVENCDVLTDRFPLFCSKPSYIELLEFVGTDVVELTGNHMNDYGHDWFVYTLDMYDGEGWPYYGGGRNLEESYKPAILESNGNKFAFLGFNWWGPDHDWATVDSPGSAPPNFEDFEEIIKDLKSKGYIVIFTFQYLESYQYNPTGQQINDFRRMIDAGASIVSGSQSHWPMGVEFRGDGFINYGLGNLFFDQMRSLGTRQGIIAKHIFYEGRHINTVMITTMLEDYSQPRLATPEERIEILNSVFGGSIR